MAECSPNSKHIHLTVPDDEFSCPLCCEVFEVPKLLSNCAHSFCKKCLKELVLYSPSSHVSCPVCRKISNVPEDGVEGFATNTLLVRLIESIPGKKEKDEVMKALARFKEEMEKNKGFLGELEKRIEKINTNKERREELKSEISQHADDAISSIQKCQQRLMKLVDDSFEKNCNSALYEDLEKHRKKWQNHMDLATAFIKAIEETMERNQLQEIMSMKNVMVEQMKEFSTFPSQPLLSDVDDQVKDVNIKFQKCEIKEDLLGEIQKFIKEPEEDSSSPWTEDSEANSDNDSDISHASDTSDDFTQLVINNISLPFAPFAVAVCPRTGQIALLWEDERKVLIYSRGLLQSTIFIKYGSLWDVGFTIADEIVVVNQQSNRLLFYNKDGSFIQRFIDPPRDCLQFTYVSIDEQGRLIVTSAPKDGEDKDIISCIIVYNHGCEEFWKMFGRRHLAQPVSRAVYMKGRFYIADQRDDEIFIQCFTNQGQACFRCCIDRNGISDDFVSLSTDNHSDRVFCCYKNSKMACSVLEVGDTTSFKKLHHPSDFWKAEVISADAFITLVQTDEDSMRIVKYSSNNLVVVPRI